MLFQSHTPPCAYRAASPGGSTSWTLEQPIWVLPSTHCSSLLHIASINPYHGLVKVLGCTSPLQPQGGSIFARHRVRVDRFADLFTFSPSGLHLAFVNRGSGAMRGRPAFTVDLVIVDIKSGKRFEHALPDCSASALQWSADGHSLALTTVQRSNTHSPQSYLVFGFLGWV